MIVSKCNRLKMCRLKCTETNNTKQTLIARRWNSCSAFRFSSFCPILSVPALKWTTTPTASSRRHWAGPIGGDWTSRFSNQSPCLHLLSGHLHFGPPAARVWTIVWLPRIATALALAAQGLVPSERELLLFYYYRGCPHYRYFGALYDSVCRRDRLALPPWPHHQQYHQRRQRCLM